MPSTMSFNENLDLDKYKEEHESDEHWELRRRFMERWKSEYPEDRLVCLARAFANVEILGCRYPMEVMRELSRMSEEVAKAYRESRQNKLKRTFVSASDAAEDRAKGVKREGGVVVSGPSCKSAKINFVAQGQSVNTEEITISDEESKDVEESESTANADQKSEAVSNWTDPNEYLQEMLKVKCMDLRYFKESMFHTKFGRMVLLIRPWASKFWNVQASCNACGIPINSTYENRCFSLTINGTLVAQATGDTKAEAKSIVEIMVWNRLREEMINVLVKDKWIAQGNASISMNDVSGKRRGDEFGTPVENSVATKMMKLMGWKGGGLGADAQGIAEPIKPNLQMVNRAGLGSTSTDIRQLRRAALDLMTRYIASDTIDLDLVFSNEFSKEERAQLHQVAQRQGLVSRSYGTNADRFLVVRKKLDPFSLIRAILEKGGNTPKYQVFIPSNINRSNGR